MAQNAKLRDAASAKKDEFYTQYMDKYNPDQFEIIDGIGRYSVMNNEETKKEGKYLSMINGKAKFFRIIIKKK